MLDIERRCELHSRDSSVPGGVLAGCGISSLSLAPFQQCFFMLMISTRYEFAVGRLEQECLCISLQNLPCWFLAMPVHLCLSDSDFCCNDKLENNKTCFEQMPMKTVPAGCHVFHMQLLQCNCLARQAGKLDGEACVGFKKDKTRLWDCTNVPLPESTGTTQYHLCLHSKHKRMCSHTCQP